MKKTLLILLLGLHFCPQALFALSETKLYPTMRTTIDQVVTIIQDDNLSKSERYAAIEKLTDPLFDYSLMAKLSLGKTAWSDMTGEQQQEYVVLFTRKIKDVYLSKLDLYRDEEIILEQPESVKKRVHMLSYIITKGEKQEVLYKFYRSGQDDWLIYDVDVLGVSIIQTYRSQFAGILKKGSVDDLLAQLKLPEN